MPDPLQHASIASFFVLVKRLMDPATGLEENDSTINQVVLNAFSQLSVEARVAVLHTASAAMHAPPTAAPLPAPTPPPVVDPLERENQLELIRMKSWIVKFTVWAAVVVFGLFVLYISYTGNDGKFSSILDFLTYIAKIGKVILAG